MAHGSQPRVGVRSTSQGLLLVMNDSMLTLVGMEGTAGTKRAMVASAVMPPAIATPDHQRGLRMSSARASVIWSGSTVIGKGSCSSYDQRRRTMTLRQSETQSSAVAQAVHQMAGWSQAKRIEAR